MIIKDRLIEVDITEALAIAGKGAGPILCLVGPPGTGKTSICRSIAEALEGLTFFAPESALTPPDALKVMYDTPENRTRAIIDSVERYDEEHGDPPTTRQKEPEQETPEQETTRAEPPKTEPKGEALAKKYSGEEPEPVPFASAPSGGALKK